MPQADLESLVTAYPLGVNDRKIACETLADGGDDHKPPKNHVISDDGDSLYVPPDLPPESYWLSKEAEYDWFDRNAFFERKDSTKGTNSNSTNLNSNINLSISQRNSVNLKSKASLIGLPKTQKAMVDSKRRTCKPVSIRLFPKRSDSMIEPGSPKVSCMGRVRSKRGCRRSNSLKRRDKDNPVEKFKTGGEKPKRGFYSKMMTIFRSRKDPKKQGWSGSRKVGGAHGQDPGLVELQGKSVSVKVREIAVSVELVVETPGLGGMKRFSSGRRSGSWTTEDFNQGELEWRVANMGKS